MISRARSLMLIGSALVVPSCGHRAVTNAIRIGSTASVENPTIAEIYGAALERDHIAVEQRTAFINDAAALQALRRGDIDLYPALIDSTLRAARRERERRRFGVTWLEPSPANVSPCLLTSQYAAEQFWLLRMSKCAAIAPRLRLAATKDFLARGGPLDRLRAHYGGFDFKTIAACEPGSQFDPLNRGDADVANAMTTDPEIAETQLVILSDDEHFWPEQHTTPAVRINTLHRYPTLAVTLDRISPELTIYQLQQLSRREHLLDIDPRNAAEEFVEALDSRKAAKFRR